MLSPGARGFSLTSALIVVAIIGILAAVGVPNIGKFTAKPEDGRYADELNQVRTAIRAMLADSSSGRLTPVPVPTADTTAVKTADDPPLILVDYMTGLDGQGRLKSGCKYTFNAQGDVSQIMP
jgi:type II secretory pathway pseudopilin PulG